MRQPSPLSFAATLVMAALACASAAAAQSLEDRARESRRLQTENAGTANEASLDSLLRERRARQGQRSGAARPSQEGEGIYGLMESDSLLAGPERSLNDSDSTALDPQGKRRKVRHALPRRYEQRVFRGVDRSVFASARGAAGRDHVLGSGDAVIVSLWGDKEKEYDLTLNAEGKIFLEGVGLVPLAGLNLDEAQAAVKSRLSRIYSGIARGSAHVDVSLGRAGPVKVFVLGEVRVPGGYVVTGNTSVLSALYFAEGPTDIGSVRSLKLTRAGKTVSLDLYDYLLRGKSLAPHTLRDGDILFSGRAEALVEISGDVGRAAVYELKKGEGVKEILEFAGGINPTAASHKLSLQRLDAEGRVGYLDMAAPREYLAGKLARELLDGDRILVEKSSETARNFVEVSGPVKYPGSYSAEGVATIKDVVERAGGLREDAFLGRAQVLRYRPDGSSQLFAASLEGSGGDTVHIQPRDHLFLYSLKDMYTADSVEIAGAVFRPGRYEFRQGMGAKDLVVLAGGFLPQHESGSLLVFRGELRERKVEQISLEVDAGLAIGPRQFLLKPYDFVQVPMDPLWYDKEVVTLGGLFLRPGKYALLHPGEKMSAVIARAGGFKPDAYVEGGRLFRGRDSIGRVGVDILKATKRPRSKADISLVGGDSLFIPARITTVRVMGEVGFETSIMHVPGAPVQYYIERAGGFTRRSERDRIVVQYANGETSRDGYFNRKPDAGSAIFVPQGPEPKPIDWISGLNALLGTLGIAAALVLSIQAISN